MMINGESVSLVIAEADPINQPGSLEEFVITHVPTPWLDGKHTVFGETTEGQDVINAIVGGDTVTSIEIHDSTEALFEAQKDRLANWNKVLG